MRARSAQRLSLASILSTAILALGISALPRVAQAEPLRILITAQYGRGLDHEKPLHFTERDTRRVSDVFTSIGGVKKESVIVVSDATTASLDAAFAKARTLAATHRPEEVSIFFYFSGHGDRQNLHLQDGLFARATLAERLGTVPANLRMAVTDACRTELVREKGVTLEPAFDVSLQPGDDASGAVWIHASANGESSQESEDLEGSIFTHYFVNALRGAGDSDGDGRVSLHEAYSFAYHQTLLRSARGSGTLQRPSASFDLKESAPFMLTEPSRSSALRFPEGGGKYYLVYSPRSHTVRAEVWGAAERSITLSLPAGRYVIQRRGGSDSGAADVVVGNGESRALSGEDFRPMNEEVLAEKGGDAFERINELSLGYGVSTSGLVDFGNSAHVTFRHHFEKWTLGVGPYGGIGTNSTTLESGDMQWIGADAFFARRFLTGRFSFELGVGASAEYFHQKFVRDDSERLIQAGYPTTRASSALVSGAFAHAEARYDLGSRVYFGLRGRGGALFGRGNDGIVATPRVSLSAELGFNF